MGMDHQLNRVSVNVAKGYRQFQKADSAISKGKTDSAVNHLNEGLSYFDTAADHLAKAEDDADKKAGNAIAEGNKELKKSIDSYADGHADRAAGQYDKAMTSYDGALDLMG
jgi:tetratricopeptide (TPR) repeat protein